MATPPYDVIDTVLNAARVRVNDAIVTISGQTMTDNAAFTPVMVNTAWRVLQNKLRAIGYTGFARLKNDLIISGLPASASADPAVQNYITWAGFYDGATTNAAKVLPQEFLSPLVLWERPNQVSNSLASPANFRQIDQSLNGIPTNGPKQSRNLTWDWRNDQLCFPGTTVIWDLRIRCLTFLPDFPVSTGSIVGSTPVPIVDCLDPFSALIAVEFCGPRGDIDAKSFMDSADVAIASLYSRDTAQPTAVRTPAEYGPMRTAYTPPTMGTPPPAPQGGR